MIILHTFLVLAAGFLTMAALVAVATVILNKLVPEWTGQTGKPRKGYILVNLGYSYTAAMAGGYVTTWLAHNNPLIHALALSLIVLLLSALSALQQRGAQPILYQLALIVLSPAGVLAGAMIRLRLAGLL